GADRMAERDRPAVDVELLRVELAHRTIQAEVLAAVLVLVPRRQTAEDLRGERLVDLPAVEVVELEIVALQYRRRGVHGTEAHLRRVEPRPLRVDHAADRLD